MIKKLLKTRFAIILTIEINKSKHNFPFGINKGNRISLLGLKLKLHFTSKDYSVVSGEGKLFTFALEPAVI